MSISPSTPFWFPSAAASRRKTTSPSPRNWPTRWARAVSCSRPVVDAKWLEKSRQVGSSGQTVKPKVYLACGISGSFQHLAGIKGNPFIVAINKNPKAPIFQVADVGIVDDILEFLPELTNKIREMHSVSAKRGTAMITKKTLKLSLKSLRDFAKKRLPDEELIALDARDECPLEIVRHMCSPDKLGIQLLFIPEEFGGMGGGTFDVYCICEEMARIDLGVATAVFATFLGSDPITVGATPEQKKIWLGAHRGRRIPVCLRRHRAGSRQRSGRSEDHRRPRQERRQGRRLQDQRQQAMDQQRRHRRCLHRPGQYAQRVRAGSSWKRARRALAHDKPEDKHGIRLSNTAALALNNVYVDADRLVGGVEGQGLIQAQAVFGYTRLMVAAFGLGAGWAALDRAIPYSTKRIQAGAPLSEKQGYTHKLIVPHVARLEAGRAYIEETAERIDAGEGSLNTEGAIAKYMATEAGNAGRRRQHPGAGRLRLHPRVHGGEDQPRRSHHHDLRRHLRDHGDDHQPRPLAASPENPRPALSRAGAEVRSAARPPSGRGRGQRGPGLARPGRSDGEARVARLTRYQHILLRLGELIAYAECAGSLARRAALLAEGKLNEKANRRFDATALAALSRIFAREAALKVAEDGLRWVIGAGGVSDAEMAAFETSFGNACHSPRASGTDFGHGLRSRRTVRPRSEAQRKWLPNVGRRMGRIWTELFSSPPSSLHYRGAQSWKTLHIEPSRLWGRELSCPMHRTSRLSGKT